MSENVPSFCEVHPPVGIEKARDLRYRTMLGDAMRNLRKAAHRVAHEAPLPKYFMEMTVTELMQALEQQLARGRQPQRIGTPAECICVEPKP